MHMKQLSPKVEAKPGLTTGAQMRFPSSLFGNERKEGGGGEERKGKEAKTKAKTKAKVKVITFISYNFY